MAKKAGVKKVLKRPSSNASSPALSKSSALSRGMAAVAHCSLNTDCELLRSVDTSAHELVATFLNANHADRQSMLKSGNEVFEAQFQPVMVSKAT